MSIKQALSIEKTGVLIEPTSYETDGKQKECYIVSLKRPKIETKEVEIKPSGLPITDPSLSQQESISTADVRKHNVNKFDLRRQETLELGLGLGLGIGLGVGLGLGLVSINYLR